MDRQRRQRPVIFGERPAAFEREQQLARRTDVFASIGLHVDVPSFVKRNAQRTTRRFGSVKSARRDKLP
jgi:hypothetical protein